MASRQSRKARKTKQDPIRNTPPSKDVFPFLDLPKELRLWIYEYTFALPKGRYAYIQLSHQVYNATNAIQRHHGHSYSAVPGILTVNKLVYREAIDILYQTTRVEIRCFADTDDSTPNAPGLGSVSDCLFMAHIQHLELTIHIDKPNCLREFVERVRPLVSVSDTKDPMLLQIEAEVSRGSKC
jgi:hypothetical protein